MVRFLCNVCLGAILPQDVRVLRCGHFHCKKCTSQIEARESLCPTCRKGFKSSEVIRIYGEIHDNEEDIGISQTLKAKLAVSEAENTELRKQLAESKVFVEEAFATAYRGGQLNATLKSEKQALQTENDNLRANVAQEQNQTKQLKAKLEGYKLKNYKLKEKTKYLQNQIASRDQACFKEEDSLAVVSSDISQHDQLQVNHRSVSDGSPNTFDVPAYGRCVIDRPRQDNTRTSPIPPSKSRLLFQFEGLPRPGFSSEWNLPADVAESGNHKSSSKVGVGLEFRPEPALPLPRGIILDKEGRPKGAVQLGIKQRM